MNKVNVSCSLVFLICLFLFFYFYNLFFIGVFALLQDCFRITETCIG